MADNTSLLSNLSKLNKQELLKRAERYIFSTGLNDSASRLCKQNMKFGLAQFHLIQEKYGFEPKATFISSPDETVSRNKFRWNSGLGYGGRLNWGNSNEKIIFLNIKPNCCGILVGGLDYLPDPYELIKNINDIKRSELYIDNIQLDWEYGVNNHFINCFETKNLSEYEFPPYVFMIHGSTPELRDDQYGLGLYVDKSKILKEMAIPEPSSLGTQYVLLDKDAQEYLEFNLEAIEFSKKKRFVIAQKIFGNNFKVICNQPHQFLKDYNNIYLGCNCTDTNCKLIESNLFPTALRADISAYLFEGKKNISETTLKNIDLYQRAEELELLGLLLNANVLPHGGGYCFPDMQKIKKILEYKDQRYFVCELKTDHTRLKIIRGVADLQFEYRGRNIVLKNLQLDLGDIIARLNPKFSLKL